MAEERASRVAGAEALPSELRERVERAAARFGSIHERWSHTSSLAQPSVPRAEGSAPLDDPGASTEASARSPDAVRVTPILGIDPDDSDEAERPRFKTLMGVPRSSPDLDELAGLDSSQDTVPVERSRLRAAETASTEKASPRVDEAPSLAGTSLHWEPGSPPASSRRISPAPWPSFAQSSLDVPAELAALRAASRRRSWWIGLGAVAAAAAIFGIAAPRQRAHALRWLENEYDARRRPSAVAISDAIPALRPGATAALASASGREPGAAQLEAPPPVLQPAPAEGVADNPRTLPEASSRAPDESTQSSVPAEPPASTGIERSTSKSKQAGREARSGTTTKPRARVAAARKPSRNEENGRASSTTRVAAGRTKARSARQNPPRKDGGGGIIRETPF
jgi:hypothetical protein